MKLKWRWPWTHARELDQRIAEAREEVRRSRALLERDRRELVRPIMQADTSNHFSLLIREGIARGYVKDPRNLGGAT